MDIAVLANTSIKNASETTTVNPVVGVKTITATAAALFAGASALVGRKKLFVRNNDPVLRFRVGPLGVTQQNGVPIEPGAIAEFTFDPVVPIVIYGISEGASIETGVEEE